MNIETIDDLSDQILDWLGVYGACKSEGDDGCDDCNPFCCRIGAMMWLPDRIRAAAENDKKLEQANLKP